MAAATAIDRVLAAGTDYEVLGLQPGASPAEVRSAYRSKAVELHPDKNDDPRAEKAFQRLSEAQRVLAEEPGARVDYAPRPAPAYGAPSEPSGPSASEMNRIAAGITAQEQREELKELRMECERLRKHERDRAPGRDAELRDARRLAAEGRAAAEKVKSVWAEKLATEQRDHAIERKEDTERIARLVKKAADDASMVRSLSAELKALTISHADLIAAGGTSTRPIPRSTNPNPEVEPIEDFLNKLRLDHHSAALKAEEIDDASVLRSMGAELLRQNMIELGLSPAEVSRMSRELFPKPKN